jgi:polyhydroxybutyrate depolymerase
VAVPVPGQGTRSALVRLPRGPGGPLPLVVALHGAYANGAFMETYTGLSRIADANRFAVAYPDAVGTRWRIGAADGDADVQFLDAFIDALDRRRCVDERRVSMVGVSNGAGMGARYACASEERLAGLVAVAGGYGSLPACAANRPLSVLEIHGTRDTVVPYAGDPRTHAGDVLAWVRNWAARDGCAPAPQRRDRRARVVQLHWAGCRDGSDVAHLQLIGGVHAWPGADGPDFGLSASVEAWRFLKPAHRL